MLKRGSAFLLVLVCACAPGARAETFDERPALDSLEHDFESGSVIDLAERTDRALGAMLELAEMKLRRHGERRLAAAIDHDWHTRYQGHLIDSAAGPEYLGDHAAWSTWLASVSDKLDAILGPVIMSATHLEDIRTVNYAVPVALHLSVIGNDVIDEAEYGRHFEPLAGVMAYWGVWISCELVTMSSGWFIVCTPAGMIAKIVTVDYLAPKFTPSLYQRFYPEAHGYVEILPALGASL